MRVFAAIATRANTPSPASSPSLERDTASTSSAGETPTFPSWFSQSRVWHLAEQRMLDFTQTQPVAHGPVQKQTGNSTNKQKVACAMLRSCVVFEISIQISHHSYLVVHGHSHVRSWSSGNRLCKNFRPWHKSKKNRRAGNIGMG